VRWQLSPEVAGGGGTPTEHDKGRWVPVPETGQTRVEENE
jgi:hypothetical protein